MIRSPYKILTLAVRDLTENGFDIRRLNAWKAELGFSVRNMLEEYKAERALTADFKKSTTLSSLRKNHVGVPAYTLESIRPSLRRNLNERILASADLIKLNKEAAVEKTLQRFTGWASSVPLDGTRAAEKAEVKSHILKPVQNLEYEARRVANDQGHKLIANINAVIADQTGAIAGKWYSHYQQAGYDYREDHKERAGHIYAIRGNWAMEQGLMKVGPDGYTDEITEPAEEINCRCRYIYLYSIKDLPENMLTSKGKEALKRVT